MYAKEVLLIRNFHFKFEGIPIILIATINKNYWFFAWGALFRHFYVLCDSPNIMILIFLVSLIMKHPLLWIKTLGPYSSTNFFPKTPKDDHFLQFSILPRPFKQSYLSHFLELWNEIFFGTSRDVILTKQEKKLGFHDLYILFFGQWT